MEAEKVSIVLPTYNGSKYLRESIDSCLNQTYSNIELIIVDDGSTDGASEIINSYKDDRIRYIRHRENKGLPNALNTGFANSYGEYLTWTSDDNRYDKEAIKEMLCFLKEKKCSLVYCDYFKFNDENSSKNLIKLPDNLTIEQGNQIGVCFLYSRKVMETIGEYDPDTKLAEDYDYWIRVSKGFSLRHLNVPLYYYRVHKKSLYVSRYYEVEIVGFLVRLKNDISPIDQVTGMFISLIAKKRGRFYRLNKILAKMILSGKIKQIFMDYKMGRINFEKAKLALNEIVKMN